MMTIGINLMGKDDDGPRDPPYDRDPYDPPTPSEPSDPFKS